MLHYLLLFLPLLAGTATPQVDIRDSEVWLTSNGQSKQLTHDGKSKLQALLSPSYDRVAYYEACPQAEHCTPAIVVLNLEGQRITSFQPNQQATGQACASILSITWVGKNAIAAECHINPSLNEYVETDLSTGQAIRNLLGYDFTPSPDAKKVAHVGWIVHFAPPFAQSKYLQIDNTTIYPLPEGVRPVEQKDLAGPPEVVRRRGRTYYGIHEFMPGLSWSPDSQRIALVDCTYDWTGDEAELPNPAGRESNRHCSVAIVAQNGKAVLLGLTDLSRQSRLLWSNSRELSVVTNGGTKRITIP
jgi:hypothetical protein